MSSRALEIKITGDSSSLNRAFGSAGREADSFGSKVGGKTTGALKGLGLVAGGAALGGIALLGKGLMDGIKSAIAHQKVMAQTEAVIKSTGAGAGVTAPHVDKLADSIEKMSGMDADAIQSGENMLLTFTNIKNGVGAGSKVFDEATRTLADMSTAMGADPQKQAVMLGKALNDPIAGVGALTKVGVTFTKGQKDSIAAMVAHGNTAGAQKVILAELQKEFGGSAKAAGQTMGGQVKILQAYLGDLEEEIANKVLPVLTRLIKWAIEHWPEFREFAMRAIQAIGDAWDRYGRPALDDIISVTTAMVGAIRRNWDAISQVVEGVMDTIRGVINVVMGLIHGDWNRVWQGIQQIVSGVLDVIVGLLRMILPAMRAAALAIGQGILDAFVNLVGSIPGWLGSLLAAIPGVLLAAVGLLGAAALAVGQAVLNGIVNALGALGARVAGFMADIGTAILNAVAGAGAAAGGLGRAVVSGVIDAVTGIGGKVGAIVTLITGAVGDVVDNATSAAGRIGRGIVSGAIDAVTGIGGKVLGVVNDIVPQLVGFIDNAGNAARRIGARIITGALEGVAGIGGRILGVVNNIADVVNQFAQDVWSAAQRIGLRIVAGVLSGLSGLFSQVKDAVSGAIGGAFGAVGGVFHGSGDFEFTRHVVGEPMARGIIEGFQSYMRDFRPVIEAEMRGVDGDTTGTRGARGASSPEPIIGGGGLRGFGGTIIINQAPGQSATELIDALNHRLRTA